MINMGISENQIKEFHLKNKFCDSTQDNINTVSITQVSGTLNIEEMNYHDLLNNKQESYSIGNNLSVK